MQLELFTPSKPERVYLNVSLDHRVYGDDFQVEKIRLGHYRQWKRDFYHMEIGVAPWDASPLGHAGILWLWSACNENIGHSHCGHSYMLNPKWNRFAKCREDAIWFACDELQAILDRHKDWEKYDQARAWLETLRWAEQNKKENKGNV